MVNGGYESRFQGSDGFVWLWSPGLVPEIYWSLSGAEHWWKLFPETFLKSEGVLS
jgi:hypothetical protein